MALAKVGQNVAGYFNEVDHGALFEYGEGAPCEWSAKQGATHTVYTADIFCNTRPAKVLKTVVYMGIDEDEYGKIVWQKWRIKNHKQW